MHNLSFIKILFALSCQFLFFYLSADSACSQATGALSYELKGHTGKVNFAAFSSDGKKVVTASDDKTAQLWDAESGEKLQKLEGHTGEVNSAVFSPDGKKIVTASWDHTARIWDTESGKELKKFRGCDNITTYIARTPMVAIGGTEPLKSIRFASFSPDGTQIVVALDLTIRILDTESGEEQKWLYGHSPGVSKSGRAPSYSIGSVAYSSDGKKIVSAGLGDGTVKVWDAVSGKKLHTTSYSLGSVHFVAFSPDDKRIVSSLSDCIFLWDADLKSVLYKFCRYKDRYKDVDFYWFREPVYSATFSPDGRELVVAARDNARIGTTPDGKPIMGGEGMTPRIVDVESGTVLLKLEGHTDQVLYAVFSPDGKKIVTASTDNTARIWDVTCCPYPANVRCPCPRQSIQPEAETGANHLGVSESDEKSNRKD